MTSPVRSYTDTGGVGWLVMSDGARVRLPGGSGGSVTRGDTGWRNMTASLINGWTGGTVRVRRVDLLVTVIVTDIVAPSTWNSIAVGAPPSGFGGASGSYGVAFDWTLFKTLPANAMTGGSTALVQIAVNAITAGTKVRGSLSYWSDAEGWPPSMPGTPWP